MTTNKIMTISDWFGEYEKHLLRANRSENTINGYRNDVIALDRFIESEDGSYNNNAEQVTRKHIESFQDYCMNKLKNKPSTVHRKISSITSFFSWLATERVIENNPASAIVRPSFERKDVDVLVDHQVQDLIDAPWDYISRRLQPHHRLRDCTMISLLLSSGVRSGELANLTVKNIKFNTGELLVCNTKGKVSRRIPLTKNMLDMLKKYVDTRHKLKPKSQYTDTLFLNINGGKYSTQGIWKIVKKYAKWAEIEENVYTHMLRHTAGYQMYKGSKNIRATQENLGHASSSTTDIYTRIDNEQQRATVDSMSISKMDFSKYLNE